MILKRIGVLTRKARRSILGTNTAPVGEMSASNRSGVFYARRLAPRLPLTFPVVWTTLPIRSSINRERIRWNREATALRTI
jgi:hypothetical protein